MNDIIRGPVTEVVDGDTFDMKVTHIGQGNQYSYNDNERIRIAGIDAPELNTLLGEAAKTQLESKIKGRSVRCYVQSRDRFGRIVAKVKILPQTILTN